MIIWKPMVGKCLHCVKERTNEMDKYVVALFRILTVKKRWFAMYNRISP